MSSVDLPPPETPVTHGEEAERDLGGDVLEIVAGGADDAQRLALLRRPAEGGMSMARVPERYCPVSELGFAMISSGVPSAIDLAAMDAGAGTDVDDMVGQADRVLVMLDDDHRVAEVAQMPERFEEAGIVALVQADRRLVEHIEHAGQPRADLRGEPDALALAAGERAARARQRQIVEADIDQEFQALADLLEDAGGDLALLRRSASRGVLEPVVRLPDRDIGDLADVQPVDLDRQRLRLQAVAVAGLAGLRDW